MSNFNGHLLLPYKSPRPVDCMLPKTCLMYDKNKQQKKRIFEKILPHHVLCWRSIRKVTFANAKLVLMDCRLTVQS